MADLPISGLPTVTVPNRAYTVAAVSASVTSQMTLSQVAAAISSSFTASQAVSASYATSASYEINYETSSSYADTASYALTASYVSGSSNSISSSYALTASYWGGGSSYVPYTGATANVDLGTARTLRAAYLSASAMDVNDSFRINGNGTTDGGSLQFKQYGSATTGLPNRTTIAAVNDNQLIIDFYQTGSTNYKTVKFFNTLVPDNSSVTLNFPSSSGTLAMLSDIGAAFPYTGSARITGSLGVTGSLNVTGSSILNGAFYIPSSSLFSANTGSSLVSYDTASGQLFHTPYQSALPALFAAGAFYSTGSITTTANQSGSFTYTTTLGINTVSLASGSRIYIDRTATYNFQFSIQIHNTSGAALIAVWLKKNDVNVPDTATYINVPSNEKSFLALNLWDTGNAGDYYELAYQTDQSNVGFETIAASGNIPQSPMVILTVNQIR